MTSTIIWTIVVITVLGLVLAVVLYLVAEKFKVEEDPRIEEVEKVMPGANCGGCGHPVSPLYRPALTLHDLKPSYSLVLGLFSQVPLQRTTATIGAFSSTS